MFCASLGSKYGSLISAEVFQMEEDLDTTILTIKTRCDLGPWHIFDLSTVKFHGNREELRKLAEVIYDAVEQLKDPEDLKHGG